MAADPHRRTRRRLGIAVLVAALALAAPVLWTIWNVHAARQAADRNRPDDALALLRRCPGVWPVRGRLLLEEARVLRRAGRIDQAGPTLDAALAAGGDPDEAALERTLQHVQLGDLDTDRAYLHGLLDQGHPDSVLILEALAQGYLRSFRLSDAVAVLDRWLALRPGAVAALLWRAQAYERQNRTGDAARDLADALALDPERREARLQLGRLLLDTNRADEALAHFDRLAQPAPSGATPAPDDPAVVLGRARARRLLGQTEEARTILDDLLARQPDHADALTERGLLELAVGEPAAAEPFLRKAVAHAPFDREPVYNLGVCLQQMGRTEEARDWQDRLRKIDDDLKTLREVTLRIQSRPRDPVPRTEAARILLRNHQNREAHRWLQSALALDPAYAPAHQLLADWYEAEHRPDEARRHRAAARPSPDSGKDLP